MIMATIFDRILLLATLLCSLNSGLLFAFATVVMPGLNTLEDREFVVAFQRIDGVIQNNQPLFIGVWAGSAAALLIAAGLGGYLLTGWHWGALLGACVLYMVCVQLPTAVINVPLNNALQRVDTNAANPRTLTAARADFESRWLRWNNFRTCAGVLVSLLLLILVSEL